MAINVKIKQKQCEDNAENEVEDIYTEQQSSIMSDLKRRRRNTVICLYVLIIFLKDTNNAGLALTLGLKLWN